MLPLSELIAAYERNASEGGTRSALRVTVTQTGRFLGAATRKAS